MAEHRPPSKVPWTKNILERGGTEVSWAEAARKPEGRRACWSDRLEDEAETGPGPVLERLVGWGSVIPPRDGV